MAELLRMRLGMPVMVAMLAVVLVPMLAWVIVSLERSGRIQPVSDPSRRSLKTDLGYLLLSPITQILSKVVTTIGIVMCAFLAHRHVGPELLQGFGPVMKQPKWLVFVEALFLSDLTYYWAHRLAHTVPLLWRLHAVHHSTQHLRWTSALRAHPVEVYAHLVTAIPLCLLGFPTDILVVLAPVVSLYAFVIHSNVNVSLRWISYFANSPAFHGWHHALDAKDGGVNFAGLFPIFDALFGTYSLPDHLPAEFGMDDPKMPETCLGQLEYALRASPEQAITTARPNPIPKSCPSNPLQVRLE